MENENRLIRVGKAVHDMCNACSVAAPGIECKPKHCSLVDAIRNIPAVDAVEFPCKPWDKVWIPDGGIIYEGEIILVALNGYTTPQEWIEYRWYDPVIGMRSNYCRADLVLGDTVFLSKEDAEKAAAERSRDGTA